MSTRHFQRLFLIFALAFATGAGHAASEADLVGALPQSKVTLADALRQVIKAGQQPLSAKFEFDDAAKLSLSVYAAQHEPGQTAATEGVVLQEMAGSPEQGAWKPETEVFKDVAHVARAAQQLALMSLARVSLLEVVEQARKRHSGIVFSVTPEIKQHQPVAVVRVASHGKVTELVYNLSNGMLLQTRGL